MTPSVRRSLLLSFLAWVGLLAMAQAQTGKTEVPTSDEYVLRVWDASDGLPGNNVSGLAQTPDGYLWVATWLTGVSRFDGMRFTPMLKQSLQNYGVQSLLTARDGALWLGLDLGGVGRFKSGEFKLVVPFDSRSSGRGSTSVLAEDEKGNIWFPNYPEFNLRCLKPGQLSNPSLHPIAPRLDYGHNTNIYPDASGRVWFAGGSGFGILDRDRVQVMESNAAGVKIAGAQGGGIWEIRGRQLWRYGPDGKKQFVAEFPWLEEGSVNVLYPDREGNLWIGTRSKGLYRFRDGVTVRVPTSHSTILSLLEDRENNLWAGTEGGLNRLRRTAFSLRQTKHGLAHDSAISLCEDREGCLWVVGRYGAPVRAKDPSNTSFAPIPGWTGGAAMSLWPDPKGGVWIGMLGDLKYWKDGSLSVSAGMREKITAGMMDQRGDIWVGTISGGLIRCGSAGVTTYPTEGGLAQPRALAQDQGGQIWVGTEAGLLFHQKGDQFTEVPLPGARSGEQIRFIVSDTQGTLWIGSLGGCLYWVEKGGRVGRFPEDTGLPVNDLHSLLIDPGGDFWFGTGRGLLRVTRSEMERVREGRQSTLRLIAYGRNEGLNGLEFSVGFRNATTRTRDGHLWFGTYSGALEISPEKLQDLPSPVPVIIESVQVGKTPSVPASDSIQIPPNSGPVQIHYALPFLSAPEQVHFRYRLKGISDEWIDADGQRTALFARLAPGDYRFEVAASEAFGPWQTPASIELKVAAAWWETTVVRLSCVLAASVALVLLVRFVVKRRLQARMRKIEQEHALERERIRIARDIHDELGSRLTRIAIASKLARIEPPEAAAAHIEEIAAVARNTAESMDEIVWAVNPRNDTLASLLEYLGQQAADFITAAEIECEVEMPEQLPQLPLSAHVRHHLFLAVKEALVNIVKHSRASTVTLAAELVVGLLRISVTDNGAGFKLGPVRAGSDGLRNMRERLAELGGECRIESSPKYGTRVIFELPLANRGAKA